jgi:hypothetical protein
VFPARYGLRFISKKMALFIVTAVKTLVGKANFHRHNMAINRLRNINKQTPLPLVRERTIPTERPPLVDEIFLILLLKCQFTIYLTYRK